jgi:glycosyltransferase involved in cell wall biosynthesis
MKIALLARHRYPAGGQQGPGDAVNPRGTGGASIVLDVLARALGSLGHEVFYYLREGWDAPEPGTPPLEGVVFTDEPERDVVVAHHYNTYFLPKWPEMDLFTDRGIPWIANCQVVHPLPDGTPAGSSPPPDRWIFASAFLASRYGGTRWVHNALDPADYIYSAAKDDYFLFLTRAEAAEGKGLDIALRLVREQGIALRVAASASTEAGLDSVRAQCRDAGAQFLGDVRGTRKAELLAGARGLIFPTQFEEAFGLVIAEALLSGTPVIASDRGACPELLGPAVGFICRDWEDYRRAVDGVSRLRPADCRAWGLERFHFHRMAGDFLREYDRRLRGEPAADDAVAP